MPLIPGGSFNTDSVASSGFEPIPEGQYTVVIKESDVKTTSKGDGQYLKLTFEVVEGDYSGRRIWSNLNLVNPNEKAVEIAQRELAGICKACGFETTPEDSMELHGIPILATVKIQPGSGQYGPSNTISYFKSL